MVDVCNTVSSQEYLQAWAESQDWQTHTTWEKFGNNSEENGHDEQDISWANLSVMWQFVRLTSNGCNMKPNRKHHSSKAELRHWNKSY